MFSQVDIQPHPSLLKATGRLGPCEGGAEGRIDESNHNNRAKNKLVNSSLKYKMKVDFFDRSPKLRTQIAASLAQRADKLGNTVEDLALAVVIRLRVLQAPVKGIVPDGAC